MTDAQVRAALPWSERMSLPAAGDVADLAAGLAELRYPSGPPAG